MNRAYRSLVLLTVVEILAAGTLAQALASRSSTTADVTTTAGLIVLIVSSILWVRVLRHLARHPGS